MLKLTRNLSLFDKAIDKGGFIRLGYGNHFHCKIALKIPISSENDDTHAPCSNVLKNVVSTVLHRLD